MALEEHPDETGKKKTGSRKQRKSKGDSTAKGKPWTFPKSTLEDAIEIAKAIEEKRAGNPMPAVELAKAVGFRQSERLAIPGDSAVGESVWSRHGKWSTCSNTFNQARARHRRTKFPAAKVPSIVGGLSICQRLCGSREVLRRKTDSGRRVLPEHSNAGFSHQP